MPDILDAAQTQPITNPPLAGNPPTDPNAPVPPPPPEPMPEPPVPPTPPASDMPVPPPPVSLPDDNLVAPPPPPETPPGEIKPKKKRINPAIIITAVLLFLVTLPLTVLFVANEQQLINLPSRAAKKCAKWQVTCPADGSCRSNAANCPKVPTTTKPPAKITQPPSKGGGGGGSTDNCATGPVYTTQARECGGKMVCTSKGWTCSTSTNPGAEGIYCDGTKCPWGCSSRNSNGGVCKAPPTDQGKDTKTACSESGAATCKNGKLTQCINGNLYDFGACTSTSNTNLGKSCNLYYQSDYGLNLGNGGWAYAGDPCGAGAKCSDTSSAGGICITDTSPGPTGLNANCPLNNAYTTQARDCGSRMVCTPTGWTCTDNVSLGIWCNSVSCPWGCSAYTSSGGVCKAPPAGVGTNTGQSCSTSGAATCTLGVITQCINGKKYTFPGDCSTSAGTPGGCEQQIPIPCPTGFHIQCLSYSQYCVSDTNTSNPYICTTGLPCPAGWSCTGDVVPGTAGTSFASKYCVQIGGDGGSSGGGGTKTSVTQCVAIVVYKDGNALSSADLANLTSGDVVTLAYAPGGAATKVRFRVKAGDTTGDWNETTTKNASSQFVWNYTLADATNFSVEAQWFDGSAWH